MQDLLHPLLAELLGRDILGLRKAVGIEEKGIVVLHDHLLLLKLEIFQNTQRQIGIRG